MLVETHVRDAAVALADGREPEGFRALLDAYKSGGRTPELAEAVVTVGERLAARHPNDPHLSAPRRYAAIADALALYTLDDPTYAMWSDPRVEELAMRWLEEARFSTGPDAVRAYDRVIQALSNGGRPAIVARLVSLFDAVRADATHPLRRDGPTLLRALARAATKERADAPPLSASARLLLESIVTGAVPAAGPVAAMQSGDELLAAVWDDPDSDEARLVYADWLSEHGDARGEFIVLQCERARRHADAPDAREQRLLAQNLSDWLRPLTAGLYANVQTARFERGFVAAGHLGYAPADGDPLVALIGHPAWATVKELLCGGTYQTVVRAAPLLVDGAMRSLRVVRDLAIADARRLVDGDLGALRWTHLGISGRDEDAHRELAARLDGLTTLESLALGWLSVEALDGLLESAVGRRLRVLAVDGPEPLPEWAAAADRLLARAPLVELRHDSGQHRVGFARHPSGGLTVTAAMGEYGRAPSYVAELLLLAPAARAVSSLTLLRPSRRRRAKDAAILEPLQAAFGARLTLRDIG